MHILIAPDSFKGSLDATQVAMAMQKGIRRVFTEATFDIIPIADGGEGTVTALVSATAGSYHEIPVLDPLQRPIRAVYGLSGDKRTAVVEMAAASGLPLLHTTERNPLVTTTFGTGQLILDAVKLLHSFPGAGHEYTPVLIIGIGGSATNDGGVGALTALGLQFLDAQHKPLPPGGAALKQLAHVDCRNMTPLLEKTHVYVACDVDNPLCGKRGASAVFGPQKGASRTDVITLDRALLHYAAISQQVTGRDIQDLPGAGAAGGLGAGLLLYTNAQLVPGVELVLQATKFSQRVARADLVFTGEGQTDEQTIFGKAPVGVAKAAKEHGKAVICLSGALGEQANAVFAHGIDALGATVCRIMALDEAMLHAADLLADEAERACRLIALGQQLGG